MTGTTEFLHLPIPRLIKLRHGFRSDHVAACMPNPRTTSQEKLPVSKPLNIVGSVFVVVARMAVCFWVGGAILFVFTSVAEQTHPQFDSVVRDQLATIRFPLYYLFGWRCLGVTLIASALGAAMNACGIRKRLAVVFCLTLLSTVVAIVDYKWVYQPLQALIIPPGQARTQEFIALHDRSRTINEVHLTIALIAAVVVCLPGKPGRPDETKA